MPITELDPYLIRAQAQNGRAAIEPDAIDLLIAKINEIIGGGTGGGGGVHMVYTCTGSEGTSIPIVFADARSDADYVVHIDQGGPAAAAFKGMRPLQDTFTTTGFTIEAAVAVEASEVIMISIFQVS